MSDEHPIGAVKSVKNGEISDKRPIELVHSIESTRNDNDELILGALTKLEDAKTRGKRKVTVAAICELTGLSRNTVRNRGWALKRLKSIKQEIKSGSEGPDVHAQVEKDEGAILDKLRKRIIAILEQNSLFYEEILSLHRVIERKNNEIVELKSRARK